MKFLVRIFGTLLIIGVVLIGVGIFGGMDITRLTSTFNQSEAYGDPIHYKVTEAITDLNVDVNVKHIDVVLSDLDELHVTYYSHTDDIWEITQESGVLSITQKQKVKLLFWFNFGFVSKDLLTLKIEIPKTWVMDYDIKTNTGDISFFGDYKPEQSHLDTNSITLETDTGSIEVNDVSVENLYLKTDTGNLALLHVFVINQLNLISNTGVIHLEDSFAKEVEIYGSTGRVEVENLQSLSLFIDSDTSHVIVKDSVIDTFVKVRISTGRINLNEIISQSYDLKTNTGDITVGLHSLTELTYNLSTNTGKVTVDGINQGNKHVTTTGTIDLIAQTTTGNIDIYVQD